MILFHRQQRSEKFVAFWIQTREELEEILAVFWQVQYYDANAGC